MGNMGRRKYQLLIINDQLFIGRDVKYYVSTIHLSLLSVYLFFQPAKHGT